VVLDVVMPHRTGRQVYDTLRAVRPEVPVVFCTGYSFGELSDLEHITGRAVLSKPYSRASLLGAVRGAIDTARSFRTNRVRHSPLPLPAGPIRARHGPFAESVSSYPVCPLRFTHA